MEEKKVVHNFNSGASLMNKNSLIIFIIVILLGVGTGYMISQKGGSYTTQKSTSPITSESIKGGQVYGVPDEKAFKDNAEGVLKNGGIEGEGAYHLERPGGDSQNVYLTSSTIDLSQFVEKKVKVWGETNSAKKAGWLMDVGRLQVQ
jgi:hypothetical protein